MKKPIFALVLALSLSLGLRRLDAGESLDAAYWSRHWDVLDQAALTHEKLPARELSLIAQSLWSRGAFEQADALFAAVESHYPPEVRPFGDLLRCLAAERRGDAAEARRRAHQLLKADPLVAYYAALSLSRLEPQSAARWLRKALTLAGDDSGRRKSVLRSLADADLLTDQEALALLAHDGRHPKALALAEKMAPSPERNYRLGWRAYALGRYKDAVFLLESVPFDSPLGQDAAYYRAVSLARLKRFAESRTLYERLLRAPSSKYISGPAKRLAALAAGKGENAEAALALMKKLCREVKDEKVTAALLSELANGSTSEAASAARELIQRFPADRRTAELLWRQGWSAWVAGDVDGALKSWNRVKAPGAEEAARVLYWRAQGAEKKGDPGRAASLRAEAADQYPLTYYGLLCGGLDRVKEKRLSPALEGRASALESWGFATHAKLKLAREKTLAAALRGAKLSLWLGQDGDAYNLLRPYYVRLTGKDASLDLLPLLWPTPWKDLVQAASARFGVAPSLIWAVMRQESAFNPTATSWTGAGGLMQLMPATAADEVKRIGDGPLNRYSVPDNIKLGASHLAWLSKRFGELHLIAAAYNGGSGNVNRWLKAFGSVPKDQWIEQIPYDETRDYVKKVLANEMIYRSLIR